MPALTANKNRKGKLKRDSQNYPVAATVQIFQGAIVSLNAAGFAVPGADTAALKTAVGVAEQNIDNTSGANGDLTVRCGIGVYKFSIGGTLVQANVGDVGLIEDDDTVDDATVNSIKAGRIRELESDGVWVEIGLEGA